MGTVFPRQSDNMKLFAVLALAAVAFAEPEAEAKADPALLYGAYGYGLPYAGVYSGGYRTYGAYPHAGYYYGKRSADAEPEANAEADPALLYGAYGYGLPYSGVYGYRTYGAYSAYPYTHGYYGKRSADAEPEAEADPALLYTTSNVVSPLTTAYTTHVAAPLTTAYAAVPYVAHSVAAPVVKTVVPQVATYTVPAIGKAPAHGVAATYAGLVHSSHVGVCLNNVG